MQVNRRSFIGGSAAALGSATLLAAFSGQAHAQGSDTIKIAFAARGLRTIDPHKSIQGVDNWAIIAIYDKLVDLPRWKFPASLDELVPRLATSWSGSEDAKTWTFELRQGVQFHKGYGEMTSEDVKFTFDRATDAPRVGGVRAKFTNIASVDTDGPYKVTFNLERPDPLFPLGVLSDYDGAIMSKKAIEEKGEEGDQHRPDRHRRLHARKRGDRPGAGHHPGSQPGLLGHQGGDPQAAVHVHRRHHRAHPGDPLRRRAHDRRRPRARLGRLDQAARFLAALRRRQPGQLLHHPVQRDGEAVRRRSRAPGAVLRHRPRRDHHRHRADLEAHLRPQPALVPGRLHRRDDPAEVAYNYDPEKAKALLAEAGFPNGFTFKNDTSQREDFSAIMLMIQDQLRRINVNMDLNIKDHTAFHADQNIGTNTLSQQSSAMPPVPTQVIVTYLPAEAEVKSDGNGGSNMSHYGVAIPGIDDLLNQALEEPDLEKRIAIVQQIEVKALTDAVILPVSNNGFLIVRSPKVDLGFPVESGYVNWPLSQAAFV